MDGRGARSRRRGLAAVAAACLVAVACTSGTGSDGPPTAENPPAPDDRSAKPSVVVPEQLPEGLLVEDLVLGEGRAAQIGDIVTVHLVTVSGTTGLEVDSTWELAAPRRVPLVQGGAVAGFLEGVVGMQVGGRRSLVVPPGQGYGDAGAPPSVPPGETLVFVVDVLSIDTPRG